MASGLTRLQLASATTDAELRLGRTVRSGAGMSMTLRERALYHQIHPVKLAVDWSAGLVSAVLLWRHRLAAALL